MAHNQWRGDFQFNISRWQPPSTDETSHRHLLHAEEGTWLNIDGFHMGLVATTSSPSVSAEFQLSAGRYHYQLVLVSKIIITGQAMSARISRKEIHYVLFKTINF
ncbi:hypothetical protein [Escherichia coli]|uniref:hypothetical protein n=1 Tax=Escherichia coli TaxID=562 RepID=UPI0038904F02